MKLRLRQVWWPLVAALLWCWSAAPVRAQSPIVVTPFQLSGTLQRDNGNTVRMITQQGTVWLPTGGVNYLLNGNSVPIGMVPPGLPVTAQIGGFTGNISAIKGQNVTIDGPNGRMVAPLPLLPTSSWSTLVWLRQGNGAVQQVALSTAVVQVESGQAIFMPQGYTAGPSNNPPGEHRHRRVTLPPLEFRAVMVQNREGRVYLTENESNVEFWVPRSLATFSMRETQVDPAGVPPGTRLRVSLPPITGQIEEMRESVLELEGENGRVEIPYDRLPGQWVNETSVPMRRRGSERTEWMSLAQAIPLVQQHQARLSNEDDRHHDDR